MPTANTEKTSKPQPTSDGPDAEAPAGMPHCIPPDPSQAQETEQFVPRTHTTSGTERITTLDWDSYREILPILSRIEEKLAQLPEMLGDILESSNGCRGCARCGNDEGEDAGPVRRGLFGDRFPGVEDGSSMPSERGESSSLGDGADGWRIGSVQAETDDSSDDTEDLYNASPPTRSRDLNRSPPPPVPYEPSNGVARYLVHVNGNAPRTGFGAAEQEDPTTNDNTGDSTIIENPEPLPRLVQISNNLRSQRSATDFSPTFHEYQHPIPETEDSRPHHRDQTSLVPPTNETDEPTTHNQASTNEPAQPVLNGSTQNHTPLPIHTTEIHASEIDKETIPRLRAVSRSQSLRSEELEIDASQSRGVDDPE